MLTGLKCLKAYGKNLMRVCGGFFKEHYTLSAIWCEIASLVADFIGGRSLRRARLVAL